jgi:RNA polymerase sigma-70 factor (family 1)
LRCNDDQNKMAYDRTFDSLTPELLEKPLHDERSLFRSIASGDEHAYKQIFEMFSVRLLSYLIRIIKSPEDAKELMQEIFLKLWVNREGLAAIESPRHYIFAIARNKAIDHLRRIALDLKMRQKLWESINELSDSTEEQVFANDSARLINEAIYKLSVQKQAVFKLSRMEGLTHDQIALQLSISKNTVKNHIVASVKFIKNYLIHH